MIGKQHVHRERPHAEIQDADPDLDEGQAQPGQVNSPIGPRPNTRGRGRSQIR